MIRALVAACLALLAISTTAAAQDAGCSKDVDCKGARICVDHACVDPPASAVRSCGSNLDCSGDDICEQHLCVPPPNVKKVKGKSRKEKEKEKEQKEKEQKAAQKKAAPVPAPEAPAQPETTVTVTPPGSAQPAPASNAPAPAAVAPAPEVQAAHSAPAPEPVQPPAAPPDLIVTPPPPLVAAAPPPAPPASSSPSSEPTADSAPIFLYGAALTAGLHTWSSTTSETDFGLDFNADFGVGITRHFGLELLGQGSYTPMLSSGLGTAASPSVSHSSFLGGFGVGLRLAHLGPIPGAFVLGGLGSFATITSSDSTPAINISGGAFLFQYGLPVFGPLQARAQLEYHFLSNGFSCFMLTVGVAIGD